MRTDYPTLETYDKTKFDIRKTTLWEYLGNDAEVEIPMGVTIIGQNSFSKSKNLKKISIPESVEFVDKWAFSFCDNLTEVSLPNGLKGILNGAFRDCKKLAKIYLPESLKVIGEGAFISCSSLEEIGIPNDIAVIKENTFGGCKSLIKVTLPENIEAIERCAFIYCSNLQEINIPDDISEIGVNAFCGCKKLDEGKIPKVETKQIREYREVDSDGKGLKLHVYQDVDYVGRRYVIDLHGMKKKTDIFNYDAITFLSFLESDDGKKAVKLEVKEGYYGTKQIILPIRGTYLYARGSVTITGPTDWEEDDDDDVMYVHLVEEKSNK